MSALLLSACVATVGACATSTSDDTSSAEGPRVQAPPPSDGGLEADAPGEGGGSCSDCEFFPADCSDGVLCPNGPFDAKDPTVGLDRLARITVIRGRSQDDVWAAGSVGTLAHFDGTTWTRSDAATKEMQLALWLRDSGEVSLGTLDAVHARGIDVDAGVSPGGWSVAPITQTPEFNPYAYGFHFSGAWSAPGSDWLWCAAAVAHVGETSGLWRLRLTPEANFELAVGVHPQLCEVETCSQMTALHGASPDTVWAVGERGAAVRIDDANGAAPTVKSFNTQTWSALNGVWASSNTDVWAVGARGTIVHYRGNPLLWDVVSAVPTDETLHGVWGTSSGDVWAVGDAGVVLHYDGVRWSRVKIAGLGAWRPNLYAVWSPGPGHVWVGGQGIILSLGGKK